MSDQDQPTKTKSADEPKGDEPKEEKPAAGGAGATDQYGRQLHEVVCSACGQPAQVPFQPSGDRPVYCRDCYMKQRQERRGGGFNRGPRR